MSLVALFAVACAQGGARASQVADPASAAPGPGALAAAPSLGSVITGIADLRRRASTYSQPEWDFLLGYAHFHDGRWDAAGKSFAAASGRLDGLGDYLIYYRAAVANRKGDHAAALALLDSLAKEFPDTALSRDADAERATALAGARRFGEAQAALGRALAGADDLEARRIEREMAEAYVLMGDSSEGVDRVKRLALSAGCERDLEDISGLISEVKRRFGVDVQRWQAAPSRQLALARSFTGQSQWQDAAARLERLLSRSDLTREERAEAKWLLAKCCRWTHRYDEAIALLSDLVKEGGGLNVSGIESTLAIIYSKKNEYDKARAIRRRMMERAPAGSRAAAEMAFKIAFLYMDEGRYDEAIAHLDRVAGMRGAGSSAVMARWYSGWCRMMKGDNAAALAAFDGLIGRRASDAKIDDRARYWKGRVLESMGRGGEAKEEFRHLLSKYPRGYYAELARRRLRGDRRTDADFVRAAGAWPDGGEWSPGNIAGQGSPRMARALIFDRLGLHAEAARELRAIDYRRNPDLAGPAMWLAERNFAHDLAYRIAGARFGPSLKAEPGKDRFGRFVWRQTHPAAYEPVVASLSQAEGVDPLLVWSVMKNESNFRPRVISPAGAVGLMQLMPTTAQRLAAGSGGEGNSREELYDPATNIAFGVTYLGMLAQMFGGNAVAMIASYNAGEEAVERWMRNGHVKDIEAWIEEIPYAETNLYVKKVLNSYWNYQRLYGREAIAQTGPRGR
ncbi:MAG: transglycosylase SLT domain-containing protein [Proteobacteria bacterium]|nr:transglycosylase SLT domain-containing protein [Pseudomonadota bacterium]